MEQAGLQVKRYLWFNLGFPIVVQKVVNNREELHRNLDNFTPFQLIASRELPD
jgi:hypothetical protein